MRTHTAITRSTGVAVPAQHLKTVRVSSLHDGLVHLPPPHVSVAPTTVVVDMINRQKQNFVLTAAFAPISVMLEHPSFHLGVTTVPHLSVLFAVVSTPFVQSDLRTRLTWTTKPVNSTPLEKLIKWEPQQTRSTSFRCRPFKSFLLGFLPAFVERADVFLASFHLYIIAIFLC